MEMGNGEREGEGDSAVDGGVQHRFYSCCNQLMQLWRCKIVAESMLAKGVRLRKTLSPPSLAWRGGRAGRGREG